MVRDTSGAFWAPKSSPLVVKWMYRPTRGVVDLIHAPLVGEHDVEEAMHELGLRGHPVEEVVEAAHPASQLHHAEVRVARADDVRRPSRKAAEPCRRFGECPRGPAARDPATDSGPGRRRWRPPAAVPPPRSDARSTREVIPQAVHALGCGHRRAWVPVGLEDPADVPDVHVEGLEHGLVRVIVAGVRGPGHAELREEPSRAALDPGHVGGAQVHRRPVHGVVQERLAETLTVCKGSGHSAAPIQRPAEEAGRLLPIGHPRRGRMACHRGTGRAPRSPRARSS